MPLDEQKVAKLADRAQHLVALKNSPSFPVYRDIIEGRVEAEQRKFVSSAVVSQQALDYARGLMFGLTWAVRVVEDGERAFQRALRQAQTLDAVIVTEEEA